LKYQIFDLVFSILKNHSAKIISLGINFTPMLILLYCFLILNFLSFTITAYDKRLAITHKKRISEETLLLFVAIGGTIGSALAMYFFNHKTSKKSYLFKFYAIIIIQIIIAVGFFYFYGNNVVINN
jgi:uncharacterized membrane protein YsdA (DUF1294 family)